MNLFWAVEVFKANLKIGANYSAIIPCTCIIYENIGGDRNGHPFTLAGLSDHIHEEEALAQGNFLSVVSRWKNSSGSDTHHFD